MNIETYLIRQQQGYPLWLCELEARQAREPPELPQNQFLQESASNYIHFQTKHNIKDLKRDTYEKKD